MKKVIQKNFFVICFVIILFATLFISPLGDDWYYKTSPNVYFNFSEMLPGKSFWRPFDALFGIIMGFIPKLFPYVNRSFVVFGHIMNVYLLKNILPYFNVEEQTKKFCVMFAMFSSAIYATVLSPDALNQVYSLLFGLLGLYLYLKNHKTAIYILLSLISVFWKESGIVWICVIPFVDIMLSINKVSELFKKKSVIKRIVKSVIIAILFVCIYFACRFMLFGGITLGSSGGKHAISVLSFKTVKNFVNIIVNAITGIDTLALFCKPVNYPLLIITSLLSLVFIIVVLWAFISKIKNKKSLIPLSTVIIVTVVSSLPHVIMGQAGEMHVYPTLFMTALALAVIFDQASVSPKAVFIAVVCIFVAFGISGAHKLTAIYEYSASTKELTQEMHKIYDPNKSLLIISADEKSGYSIFTQPAIYGSYYGDSLRPYFDWKELNIDHKVLKGEAAIEEYINNNKSSYDVIWLVRNDKITVIEE